MITFDVSLMPQKAIGLLEILDLLRNDKPFKKEDFHCEVGGAGQEFYSLDGQEEGENFVNPFLELKGITEDNFFDDVGDPEDVVFYKDDIAHLKFFEMSPGEKIFVSVFEL